MPVSTLNLVRDDHNKILKAIEFCKSNDFVDLIRNNNMRGIDWFSKAICDREMTF